MLQKKKNVTNGQYPFGYFGTGEVIYPVDVVLLVHMDEKWFYGVEVRKNNKYVPFLGTEPVIFHVRHKNHIYKVMNICTTAYLHFNNDMTAGGLAYKVCCVRVGKAKEEKKVTVEHTTTTERIHTSKHQKIYYEKKVKNISRTQN